MGEVWEQRADDLLPGDAPEARVAVGLPRQPSASPSESASRPAISL